MDVQQLDEGDSRGKEGPLATDGAEQVGQPGAKIAVGVGDPYPAGMDGTRRRTVHRITELGLGGLNLEIDDLGREARPQVLIDPLAAPLGGGLLAAEMGGGLPRITAAFEVIIE